MASPQTSKTPSILQLVLGIISLALSLLGALAMVIVSLASQQFDQATSKTVSYVALISLAIGLSVIPSIVYSIKRISQKNELSRGRSNSFLYASLSLVALVPLGWLTTLPTLDSSPAWFMALANCLFISVAAWWFIELGSLRLPRITRQKTWGLLNFSAFFTMPVVIIVEGLFLVVGAALLIAWLVQQPEYAAMLNQLQNLMYVKPESMPLILEQFEPLLKEPGVIALVFLTFSLIIPMVEELFKPLALWFFIKRQWSPTQGFIAGMICGGAFAIVESLIALASVDSATWLVIVAARSGTALLHIFTAGLSGWALTSSWLDGKYLRVGIIYLLTVFIHGLWNFLAVSVGFSSFTVGDTGQFFTKIAPVAPWIMGIIVALMIILLILVNNRLRKIPPPMPLQG